MMCKLIRCGICLDWHMYGKNCANCGAYHLTVNGKVVHLNRNGIEMVRGIPIPYEKIVSMKGEQ